MTEIKESGVYATRDFCEGDLVATYGVLSHQVEPPGDTDMFLEYNGMYAVGDPNTETAEHAQFITDSASTNVRLDDGATIYDIYEEDIKSIISYLRTSIRMQNVSNAGLRFYACRYIHQGDKLHLHYGTTYWLHNDLIDVHLQDLAEEDSELWASQGIADEGTRVCKVYKAEKRIIMDFIDILEDILKAQ